MQIRFFRTVIVAAAAWIAAAACMKMSFDSIPTSNELTVTGNVYDIDSHAPIKGIRIVMTSSPHTGGGSADESMSVETLSNADGYFSVTIPRISPKEDYSIKAEDIDGSENGEYLPGGIDAIEWDGRINLIPGQSIFLKKK